MGFSNLVLLQRHGHLRVHDPAVILLAIPRDKHLKFPEKIFLGNCAAQYCSWLNVKLLRQDT